jgi:general nucleoside transport system permease protein
MMLVGALIGFLTALHTGSPVLAFVAGGLGGACMAALHGIVCIWFMGNQVVSGLALTIFGTGLAGFFGTPYIGRTAPGFDKFSLPLLGDIPVLGTIFFQQDAWSISLSSSRRCCGPFSATPAGAWPSAPPGNVRPLPGPRA